MNEKKEIKKAVAGVSVSENFDLGAVVSAVGIKAASKLSDEIRTINGEIMAAQTQLQRIHEEELPKVVGEAVQEKVAGLCKLAGVTSLSDVRVESQSFVTNLSTVAAGTTGTLSIEGDLIVKKKSNGVRLASLLCTAHIEEAGYADYLAVKARIKELNELGTAAAKEKSSLGTRLEELQADIVLEQVAGTELGALACDRINERLEEPASQNRHTRQMRLAEIAMGA